MGGISLSSISTASQWLVQVVNNVKDTLEKRVFRLFAKNLENKNYYISYEVCLIDLLYRFIGLDLEIGRSAENIASYGQERSWGHL